MNKAIWQGIAMKIRYSDTECEANYLKIKWLENKIEDTVLMRNVSVQYIQRKGQMPLRNIFVGITWKNQFSTSLFK